MRQNKLIQLLLTLTARERTRWMSFVMSAFVSKNAPLRQLCSLLFDLAPSYEAIPAKSIVFIQIYGNDEPYNELKINNLISDLYETTLQWLAWEAFSDQTLEQQRLKVLALTQKNLDHHASVALKRYFELLEKHPERNSEWYRHLGFAEQMAEFLHGRQGKREISEHLQNQASALTSAHLLEKLRLILAFQNRSTLAVVKATDKSQLQIDIHEMIRNPMLIHKLPVAEPFVKALELMRNPAPELFQELKQSLLIQSKTLGKKDAADLYQCALNYCIGRINTGHQGAYMDAFEIYRILIDQNLLLQNNRLSQWTYKNIATVGLRSGAFDWTEQFLETYIQYLPEPDQANAFAYNIATVYFEKQNYDKALKTLQDVKFKDISYHIGAKIIQLKTFFLLSEWDALLSFLSATTQVIRRDKSLSNFGKTTNLNFLNLLKATAKWAQKFEHFPGNHSETKRLALIQKIEKCQPVSNKDWLLKVLNQRNTFVDQDAPVLGSLSNNTT
ncbi:MAG: hypothetical protein JNJ57_03495 [Saprospiraceae bacterium]|nr:hypothetical protein [Saprospiraceae bacterium]